MLKKLIRTMRVNKEALKLHRKYAFVKEKNIVEAAKLIVWHKEISKDLAKLIENAPAFFAEDLAEIDSQMQEQFDSWVEQTLNLGGK